MKQKVAASFAIVLALAMMLSTNPAIIMPSNILASTEEDDSSTDDSDSSENESEEQEESEPETPEEETETEPEAIQQIPFTAPELVECPDGSQAATLAECPTATATLAAPTIAPPCDPSKQQCPPTPPCDPSKQQCPPTPITCGKGTHLENGKCVPNRSGNGGSGSSSSSSSSSSASATANVNVVEVSNCRLDGNAHGIRQQFDTAKYQACGLYSNGQIAYTDGFIAGCTQAGNTQQMCVAFIQLNTGTQATTQTQAAIPPAQAIQPVR